jgi:hypothetical protein
MGVEVAELSVPPSPGLRNLRAGIFAISPEVVDDLCLLNIY